MLKTLHKGSWFQLESVENCSAHYGEKEKWNEMQEGKEEFCKLLQRPHISSPWLFDCGHSLVGWVLGAMENHGKIPAPGQRGEMRPYPISCLFLPAALNAIIKKIPGANLIDFQILQLSGLFCLSFPLPLCDSPSKE